MLFHSRPLSCIAAFGFLFALIGCGSGTTSHIISGTSATIPPSIITQPASITVPIGLEGIFTVGVNGNGTLTEQWYRNGTAISSADALSYTTSTVAATDTGSVFTVTISNSLGSVTSQPATLTAGARAPENGDLRFQQVDSLNTVNGYGTGTGSPEDIIDHGGEIATDSFGILNLGYEECPPGGSPIGCVYFVTSLAQPSGVVPLSTGFISDFYDNFETDLSTGFFSIATTPFGGGPLLTPNTVITALAISTDADSFAMSYTQTSQAGGFDLAQHTIDPSQIQAAATQEGQSSRVITAVTFNAGQITYFSYGWTGDTTTVYETQTATATFDNVGTVASSLADESYIITAIGGDATDGIVLIGTRVQGNTLPRPILLSQSTDTQFIDLAAQGYAIVGVVDNFIANPGTSVTIGER